MEPPEHAANEPIQLGNLNENAQPPAQINVVEQLGNMMAQMQQNSQAATSQLVRAMQEQNAAAARQQQADNHAQMLQTMQILIASLQQRRDMPPANWGPKDSIHACMYIDQEAMIFTNDILPPKCASYAFGNHSCKHVFRP